MHSHCAMTLMTPKLRRRRWLIALVALLILQTACKPKLESSDSATQGTLVQFCPPFQTSLERDLWLSLVEHYVAKKLFSNYMSCSKKPLHLGLQEMADIQAGADLRNESAYLQKVLEHMQRGRIAKRVLSSNTSNFQLLGMSSGGTLGRFTIHFSGHMVYSPLRQMLILPLTMFYSWANFGTRITGTSTPKQMAFGNLLLKI